MTNPKWLVPVLALAAIFIAAVLVGVRFAPSNEVQPGSITVPVLSPINDRSVEPGADVDGGSSLSAIVGEATVVEPSDGDPHALTADDEAYLADLGLSDDPGSVFPATAGSDGSRDGDPCAIEPAGADCPSGVTATILDLDLLPEFAVRPAPTSERACEGSFHDSPTQDRFDIITNAPASIDLEFSQAGVDTRTLHLETSAAERARWSEDFSANTSPGAWIFTSACAAFTDLVPNQRVALHIVATDDLGRVATADRTFATVSGLVRPPVEIYPAGNSLIWATVPHTASQRAEFTAFAAVGDREPTCEQRDGGLVRVTRLATRDVDAAVLASHSYLPEFTRSTTQTFAVPEASTIVVCARLYPRSGGTNPEWQSSTVFQSPDVAAPLATIDLVRLTRPMAAGSVTILGSTESGSECGRWTGPEIDGLGTLSARGQTLCDFGGLIGRRNADGSLVVTTRVQTDHGIAERGALLPVSLISCPGGCGTSPDRYFDLPISNAVRPSSICGSGPGCDDDPAGVVGYFRVKVSWSDGVTAGNPGWLRGASSEGAYRAPRPELPSIINLSDPFVLGTGSGGADIKSAHLTLTTDRPVTFRAWIDGDCFAPDSVRELSGSALSTRVRLDFEDICSGTNYTAHVQLTDADGVTAVWGADATEQRWWNSRFTTAGNFYRLGVEVSVTHDSPTVNTIQVNRLDVGVGYETSTVSVNAERPTNCFPRGSAIVDERLAGDYPRKVRIQVVGAFVGRNERTPDSGETRRCSPAVLELAPGHVNAVFTATYEQISAGFTRDIYDPVTGYTVHLRLTKHG